MQTDPTLTNDEIPAKVKLLDVCAVTGRGTVALVGDIKGVIGVKDVAVFPSGDCRIVGIEGVRITNRPSWPDDTVGLMLEGVPESAIRMYIGQTLTIRSEVD